MALAACCALALTGCGSSNPKPAPAPSTSVTQSASPTASPSPVAPTMPAEAKGTSAAAAKAFVKHYLAVFSYAARTGDTAEMEGLSAPDCKSCNDVVTKIQKVYSAGGYARGKGYAGRGLKAKFDPQNHSRAVVRGTVTQFPQLSRDSATAEAKKHGKSSLPSVFTLTRHSGSWRLSGWERL